MIMSPSDMDDTKDSEARKELLALHDAAGREELKVPDIKYYAIGDEVHRFPAVPDRDLRAETRVPSDYGIVDVKQLEFPGSGQPGKEFEDLLEGFEAVAGRLVEWGLEKSSWNSAARSDHDAKRFAENVKAEMNQINEKKEQDKGLEGPER